MTDEPWIDLTKIDFPSDNLTIRTMRRMYPDEVDKDHHRKLKLFSEFIDSGARGGDEVSQMLFNEREIATYAYIKAAGKKLDPVLEREWKPVAGDLAEEYVRYGLATGKHHAEQLIRDIESQAAEQGRQHAGKGV